MSDVTHAMCPRCSDYEPLVWTPVVVEQVSSSGDVLRFEGLTMKCRTCDMEITSVGTVEQRFIA